MTPKWSCVLKQYSNCNPKVMHCRQSVFWHSHFRCILDISFGAVKLQSKSDALPTKCVLTHSHFRGILELSFGSNMHFNALIQKQLAAGVVLLVLVHLNGMHFFAGRTAYLTFMLHKLYWLRLIALKLWIDSVQAARCILELSSVFKPDFLVGRVEEEEEKKLTSSA